MRRLAPVLVAVLVLVLAGCGPAMPSAMSPTLDAWRALGMTCGAPREDNVPNDLLQWTCRGTVEGIDLTAVIDGNGHGVFGFVAQVQAGTDPKKVGGTFAALAEATPFLSDPRGAIVAWIRAEIDKEARTSTSLEGAIITLEHDATWITLNAFPEDRPGVSGSLP